MKMLIVFIVAVFLICAISGCAQDTLERPETNLEFWIAENVEDVDFSGYAQRPGMMGGHQYYGAGYVPGKDEDGNNVDPEHCVVYTATSYPDYSDRQVHITGIVITDPEIYFYGLSIAASFEEFESVMAANGFAVTKETEDRFYAEKGRFTIRFNGDSIKISVSVTNKTGIVF